MEEETAPSIEDKDILVLATENNEIITCEPFCGRINAGIKTHPWYKKKFKAGCYAHLLDTIYAYDSSGAIYTINPIKTTEVPDMLGFFTTENKKYIIHVTDKGTVKKSLLTEYNGFKRTTVVGKIRPDEKVIFVGTANEEDYLLLVGTNGKISKVSVADFNSTGKATIGVKGMATEVVSACIASDEDYIWCLADEKYKITSCSDYLVCGKNASGYAVAENTVSIVTVPRKKFYLIENGVKIISFSEQDYVVKGKTAQGNKTTKDAKIIW
jgi:DNA gyrase/topoisomerase IV subunit A